MKLRGFTSNGEELFWENTSLAIREGDTVSLAKYATMNVEGGPTVAWFERLSEPRLVNGEVHATYSPEPVFARPEGATA